MFIFSMATENDLGGKKQYHIKNANNIRTDFSNITQLLHIKTTRYIV